MPEGIVSEKSEYLLIAYLFVRPSHPDKMVNKEVTGGVTVSGSAICPTYAVKPDHTSRRCSSAELN